MADAAGRRNILRELIALGDRGDLSNVQSNNISELNPTSPDETVIQHRGLKIKEATYKYNAPDPHFFRTPTKSPEKFSGVSRFFSPTRNTPTRSSPRKRCNLTPEKLKDSETGIANLNISCKRLKKGPLQNVKASMDLENGLKALSHAQLVQLINTVLTDSKEIRQVFEKAYPVPDLSLIEQKLHVLQRNIYKSIPRNIWGSQDSSFCYLRVRTHLEVFKKECLDVSEQLMDSHHWPTVFEYIFIAWKYTLGLPDWNTVSHNKIKTICLKQLATQCIIALKKADLNRAALLELIDRMEEFSEASAVKSCIKYAGDLLKYSGQN